ncbi:MAG: hypothetical protein ABI596_08870 [Pyrinomonadaceae bacterium]
MKRCQKCGRTYSRDEQKFCTHDGGNLIPSVIDPNSTVPGDVPDPTSPIAPDQNAADAPTRTISRGLASPAPPVDPYATMVGARPPGQEKESANAGPTVDPYATMVGARPPAQEKDSANTGPTVDPYATMVGVKPPRDTGSRDTGQTNVTNAQPPAPQVSAPLSHSSSAPLPPAVSAHLPPPATPPAPSMFTPPLPAPVPAKKSKMPLILAILAILLFVGLGAIGAGYFFFVHPMLEAQKKSNNVVPPEEVNQNSNSNLNLPTPSPESSVTENTESGPSPFVPPADAVEFVNSSDNLDGKLAEHYLDFSFHYPASWRKDPQAGVPGSSDFVKVERRLPPDFTQENFSVSWYASGGSLAADRKDYPNFVKVLGAKFANSFPGYRKLSEGETKVNAYEGYEFRFQGVSENTAKGDITLWGRVIFLPPKSGTNGAILLMTATSLAPEIDSAEDVGVKGGLPLILESFRLGTRR